MLQQPQVPPEPATPSYEKRGEIKLEQVRAFYLRTPSERGNRTESPYNTSFGGDLDGSGRFACASPDNEHNSWDFVLIDANGKSLIFPTGISSDGMNINHVVFTSVDSALIVGEFYVTDRKAAFWTIDLKTGKVGRIWQNIRRQPVNQILRLTNGNFLVHSYLGIDVITPEGKVVWEEKLSNESPFKAPYRLSVMIAGVGELPGKRIAVGSVFSQTVTVFDQTGKMLETIELQAPPTDKESNTYAISFGQPPVGYGFLNYDSFVVDVDGSYWSCNENFLYHFDSKGKFLSGGRIRAADGFLPAITSIASRSTWMRPAGAGRVWVSSGQELYLCDETGKIVDTAGPKGTRPSMESASSITFDPDGNLLCIDYSSRAIHRFAYSGAYLGLASDALRKEDRTGSLLQIDCVPNGNIFVHSSENRQTMWVVSKAGDAVKRVPLKATNARPHPHARMGSKFIPVAESWFDDSGNAVGSLVDENNELVYAFRETSRDFRGWFVGADFGSAHLFDHKGKCVGMIDYAKLRAQHPLSNLAYNGQILVALAPLAGLYGFSPKGDLIWEMSLPGLDDLSEYWIDVALSQDGKEIAVLAGDNLVKIYKLP